jgi:hypothetical protein
MQQALVRERGLKTTIFVNSRCLHDTDFTKRLADEAHQHGDELGLALHDLGGSHLDGLANGLNAIWLFPQDVKETIIGRSIDQFEAVFGYKPETVAAYHLDAGCLKILHHKLPGLKAVVGGCFEEGVRVFHGCNHSWYLFNEGMPWNPWYPSHTHSLRPANGEEDGTGILAVPHLSRDMSLAYEGRNDFWATHPPNVIRGMGNEATWCPYDLNLIDQYRLQADWNNGYAYINTFVSAAWLTWNHNSEYPPEVAIELYRKQLDYFVDLQENGELENQTLGHYADWHKANRRTSDSEVYWSKELLYGSSKHYFWYLDPAMRVLVDTHQGGSIGDLRAYLGKVPVTTGPNSPHREIGTYPYLIQSQHRTGFPHHYEDGSRTTAILECGSHSVDLCACPTRISSVDRSTDQTVLILKPHRIQFPDTESIVLQTEYQFYPSGKIIITRRLLESTARNPVHLTERWKIAPGRTEYAEPMHGIWLCFNNGSGSTLDFAYRGRTIEKPSPGSLSAIIPSQNVSLEMEPVGGKVLRGKLAEGHLFSPYVTLAITYAIKADNPTQTCIHLKSIN